MPVKSRIARGKRVDHIVQRIGQGNRCRPAGITGIGRRDGPDLCKGLLGIGGKGISLAVLIGRNIPSFNAQPGVFQQADLGLSFCRAFKKLQAQPGCANRICLGHNRA